jgi:hypothetical protein
MLIEQIYISKQKTLYFHSNINENLVNFVKMINENYYVTSQTICFGANLLYLYIGMLCAENGQTIIDRKIRFHLLSSVGILQSRQLQRGNSFGNRGAEHSRESVRKN